MQRMLSGHPSAVVVRVTLALALALGSPAACTEKAELPVEAGMGPNPTLPPPKKPLMPTVQVATARGWPQGAKPNVAEGVAVNAFAAGLAHPRWLHVLPNG